MSTAAETARTEAPQIVTDTPTPDAPEAPTADAALPEIALQNPEEFPEVGAGGEAAGEAGGEESELSAWLGRLVASLAPEADSFTARFVGDDAMRELNRRYRGKDKTTDVLSFPGGETPEGWHLGDVVISLPAARSQAPEESAGMEIRRLLLHGVLHCLGHDHETDDGEMDALEARLRREWL